MVAVVVLHAIPVTCRRRGDLSLEYVLLRKRPHMNCPQHSYTEGGFRYSDLAESVEAVRFLILTRS